MFKLKFLLFLLAVTQITGCSSRTSAINSCSFEVQKLLLPWVRPDGTIPDVNAYNLREADLISDCIASKGWIFNNARANAEYKAGRSPGLVSQYKDPANWSFGWFGLVSEGKSDEKPSPVSKP